MVVLKRLSQALADNDPIYAIIRGSAVNQDGRSDGLTVPSADAQMAILRDVLSRAGVEPSEVGYVEAHGTGTPVGDPIEARATGHGPFRRAERPRPLRDRIGQEQHRSHRIGRGRCRPDQGGPGRATR